MRDRERERREREREREREEASGHDNISVTRNGTPTMQQNM